MPDYGVRSYQLNFYLRKYLPEIYYHFKKNKIPVDLIYQKWLITIFSQYVTFENVTQIWTLFFIVYILLLKRIGGKLLLNFV